jgi:hypothetical protein
MPGRGARAAALALAILSAAGCTSVGSRSATDAESPGSITASTPGAGEARPAVQAFAQLIAREDLAFHVDETISSTGGGGRATVSMDVAGSDFAATIDIPGVKSIELRHVGGITFARQGKGKWRSGTADERLLDELTDPWLYLCWLDDLELTVPADPPGGFTLACSKAYDYQSPLMRQAGKVGRIESLQLVLDADGRPVTMTLSGSGPTMATDSDTFRAIMSFSSVGDRIEVKAPKT